MNRKLLHLSIGFLFVNMGWGMAWPYLPNYMKILGGGIIFISLLSILFNITSSVGQYFWGRRADQYGRKKPFIFIGISSGMLFYLLMGIIGSSIALLTLRTFQGFFVSSQTPSVSALVSEISTDIGRGFGIFNTFSNIGFMLGNFTGGFIVQFFPVNYVFIFSSIPFIISMVILIFFKEEGKKAMDFRFLFRYDRPGRTVFQWGKGKEFLRRNRNLAIFSFSIFILMLSSGMVYSFLSILIGNRFGNSWVGLYFGIDGGISSLLIYPFGYLADRIGSKYVVLVGLLTYMLAFYFYFIAHTVILLIVAAIFSATKWASYFNSINTYVSRMSRREERATALGIMNSAISLGWVFGPILGSLAISYYGLDMNFLLAIFPVILSLFIVLFFVENDRNKIYKR